MTGGSPLRQALYPAFGARRVLEHFDALLLLLGETGRILRVEPETIRLPGLSVLPGRSLPGMITCPAARNRVQRALAGGEGVTVTAPLSSGAESIELEIRIFRAPYGSTRRWGLLSPPRRPSHLNLSGVEGLGLLLIHEVNNVLTALAGFAEYQRASGGVSPEVREALDEAWHLAKRSAEIMEFLRNMLRRRNLEEAPLPEDPNQALREILATAGWLLGRKHRLETRLDADPAPIPLRPNLLRLALLNLLLNAGKAMGPLPGTIRMETREEEGRVSYLVADSGPGIQNVMEEKIFEPGVTGGTGLGLGLALVKEVALLHGGSVEASPLPKGGLQVILRIPRN